MSESNADEPDSSSSKQLTAPTQLNANPVNQVLVNRRTQSQQRIYIEIQPNDTVAEVFSG